MKKMNLTAIIAAMTIAASAMTVVPAAAAQAQITEVQAKEIALKDAGLKEAEVTFVRSNIDYDDGVMEYEVEFFSRSTEYDYDIDAMTGAIRARILTANSMHRQPETRQMLRRQKPVSLRIRP